MAMAFEVLGISPMGSSMVPAEDGKKGKVAEECGRLVIEVLAARTAAPARSSRSARSRTRSRRARRRGGSTNLVLHLLAVAHEAGVELELEDFDRIAWQTPLLCDLKPGGRYVATDLYRAGGVPLVIKRLKELGALHEDELTVTGQTIGEVADAAEETEGQDVVRPRGRPDQAERRLRDPARQPRAGGLRGEAVGPRPHGAQRARRACSSARRTPSPP